MERFSEWNLRLLRSFFSEASREEEVFLRVDRDLLDQIGQDIGGDKGFLEAVRGGPAWLVSGLPLVRIVRCLVLHRSTPSSRPAPYVDPGVGDPAYLRTYAPTYLPYLAALVRNDAEHPHGYYEGLKTDLQLEHVFNSGEMGQLELAWNDLQDWTKELHGKYGWFQLRTLGGYRRIGIPRSQSILHHRDVEELPRAFVQAEILPGHELDESEVTKILNEVRASSDSYSAAFRSALNNSDFEQPIRAAVAATYADWDGTIPARRQANQVETAGEGKAGSAESRFGFCLAVIEDDPLALAPLWLIPPLQDSGRCQVKHPDSETVWEGFFTGTEGVVSKHAPENVDTIWEIAEQAYYGPVNFRIHCFSSEDSDPTTVGVSLPQRQLWILTAVHDGVNGEIELREGGLPGSGQAFLLAGPENVNRLKEYLEREQPEHSIISAIGLPANWLLVQLHECGDLTSEQRRLPDGADGSHPKPRAIRFVGGRSVKRGYSRMYLPYDLPSLELDAPGGARLEVPAALTVKREERSWVPREGLADAQFKPRQKFEIEVGDSNSASYEIRVLLGAEVLGKAKLRVAGEGGELVRNGQSYGVDNLGRAVSSREGLSGIAPSTTSAELYASSYDDPFRFPQGCFGRPTSDRLHLPSASEKFLDSLAQSGSVAYGTARDQIARLLHKEVEDEDAPLILLELRSRGHLEISMTNKGHMSRVHAVEPTVYELPVIPAGKRSFGVTGTLRLSHWAQLAEKSCAWVAFRGQGTGNALKPLRLLADDHATVRAECKRLGLRFSASPAPAVAEWSSQISSIRDEIFSNPMESIGSAQGDAQRFNPSKGRFTAHPAFSDTSELWKVRDLDIGMANNYVLYDQGKYVFVRASRWGVWIALDSFAEWASHLSAQMKDVHPIPITYSSRDGTLWLPARIGFPFVLERALVLCSGDLPEVLEIENFSSNDSLHLSIEERSAPVLTVNRFYQEMAVGKWLAYRWVPRSVACQVVEKLGARLDVI